MELTNFANVLWDNHKLLTRKSTHYIHLEDPGVDSVSRFGHTRETDHLGASPRWHGFESIASDSWI